MTTPFPAAPQCAVHLSAARIAAFASALPDSRCAHITIETVAETGSTNADLLARIDTDGTGGKPILLVAETQTAGRGRAGRRWLSAPLASLTFSLAWPFTCGLQTLVGLPLAVGVAIAEALADFDVPVQLKWPNDVLQHGRKLAGILIETVKTSDNQVWAVIGIGINIAISTEIEQQIGHCIANLSSLAAIDRNMLLATLLNHLASSMQQFARDSLDTFVARWNQLHAYGGQQVLIMDQGQILCQGVALGIDHIGRLLLQTDADSVPQAIMVGDISLRTQEMV